MEDFRDAAQRHWYDAEILLNDPTPHKGHTRLANASHLYGVSAECALKAILHSWTPNRPKGKHMPAIWDEFATHANTATHGLSAFFTSTTNPFIGWNIGDRYLNRSDTRFNQAAIQVHRNAALSARAILEHAVINGMI
jgi:hypothetical protein